MNGNTIKTKRDSIQKLQQQLYSRTYSWCQTAGKRETKHPCCVRHFRQEVLGLRSRLHSRLRSLFTNVGYPPTSDGKLDTDVSTVVSSVWNADVSKHCLRPSFSSTCHLNFHDKSQTVLKVSDTCRFCYHGCLLPCLQPIHYLIRYLCCQ